MVKKRLCGFLLIEMVVAIAIFAMASSLLAAIFIREVSVCRHYYQQAVAMEIVDGEMEILVAGEWKTYSKGKHDYKITARAVENLPQGKFLLTVEAERLRLEWIPNGKPSRVIREADIREQ